MSKSIFTAFPVRLRTDTSLGDGDRHEIRFRAATGHSVLEEIQNVRFIHALELVRDSSIALGAIADRTGWPSSLVLSRYVRQRTGKTLSQLRKAGNAPETSR